MVAGFILCWNRNRSEIRVTFHFRQSTTTRCLPQLVRLNQQPNTCDSSQLPRRCDSQYRWSTATGDPLPPISPTNARMVRPAWKRLFIIIPAQSRHLALFLLLVCYLDAKSLRRFDTDGLLIPADKILRLVAGPN